MEDWEDKALGPLCDDWPAVKARLERVEELDYAEVQDISVSESVGRRAAEAEVARLRKALERMVKDGCGFAPRVCPERSPDSGDWCWSCQARAALRGDGEGR